MSKRCEVDSRLCLRALMGNEGLSKTPGMFSIITESTFECVCLKLVVLGFFFLLYLSPRETEGGVAFCSVILTYFLHKWYSRK